MTVVGDLINDASGATPVTSLLRKLKVIAARSEVPVLAAWVEHELNGYGDADTLPPYRGPFDAPVRGDFAGPFGSGLRNAPIPESAIAGKLAGTNLFTISFMQPVAELESLADAGEDDIRSPWLPDVVGVINSLLQQGSVRIYNHDHGLLQAWRVITRAQLVGVLDAVRTRVLDLALEIEAANPQAGEHGAAPLPQEVVHTVVNIIGGTSNLAIGSSNFVQATVVNAGDWEALARRLSELGVPGQEVEALEAAIEEDGGQEGLATRSWLSKVLLHGKELGIAVGGELIAAAIRQFFGF